MSNHIPPPLPSTSSSASSHAAPKSWERATLEKLVFATLKEQRTARRWRNGIRIAGLLLFALMVIGSFMRAPSGAGGAAGSLEPHTAVVDISGVISEDSSETNARAVIANAKRAFENTNAKAVLLRINSPGGSPVQSGIINDELLRLKEQHKKPLYAVVGDSCASGAYYIAVAADKIFVDKASVVGSIGVIMSGFGFTETMEKMGVERRLLTAGTNKGLMDPFSPVDPTQQEHMQTMLNQIHEQFIEVVRKNRGSRLKENEDTFSGLVWTGQQAVQLGLVDELGSVDSVARDVVKQEKVVDYTRRDNVAERLAKKFGASVGAGAVRALQMQTFNGMQ